MPEPGHVSLPSCSCSHHLDTQLSTSRNVGPIETQGEKSYDYDFKLQAFKVILRKSVVTGAAGIPNGGQSESSYADGLLLGMRSVGNLFSHLFCPQPFSSPPSSSSPAVPSTHLLPGPCYVPVRVPDRCAHSGKAIVLISPPWMPDLTVTEARKRKSECPGKVRRLEH